MHLGEIISFFRVLYCPLRYNEDFYLPSCVIDTIKMKFQLFKPDQYSTNLVFLNTIHHDIITKIKNTINNDDSHQTYLEIEALEDILRRIKHIEIK
jgi:hypothetical protein